MSFSDHFNSISNYIVESKTGTYTSMNMYGFDALGYANGSLGPVNFWASDRVDEHFETGTYCLGVSNPLVIESDGYNLDDVYFATRCVGYAVENNYDSVIIETEHTKYAITIDFNYGFRYLSEAGELKGKTLPKRQELQNKQVKKRPPTANKPKQGDIPDVAEPKAPPQGIRVDVLLANTGKLSPKRAQRGMNEMSKNPPKLTGVKELQGNKYFRAEYNFRSMGAGDNQIGYADISQNKEYCHQLFCTCSDFFYRLYAPYVKVGLATWNLPPKYAAKQNRNNKVGQASNHKWTKDTNPAGDLFLCKHLWAFMAYYVAGDVGGSELSDEEIEDVISQYFKDIDGDGEEERIATDFEKAFGKLYMDQKGKDIEHIAKPLAGKKVIRKATDELPIEPKTKKVKAKDIPNDILSQIGKNIDDQPEIDDEV